ncbi:MAG: hypothetical protein U0174_16250 [Polyangiaceae bacterium]
MPPSNDVSLLLAASRKLSRSLAHVEPVGVVAYVYNPLDYADALVKAYLTRFGTGPKEVLFLGMNPGPFGMGQTGVPFGEVSFVRDWMKLEGKVSHPRHEHPKRPVEGLACKRSEVSGARLWGAIRAKHEHPETFFARALVVNYCPLLFLGETGANVTPDKLPKQVRADIEAACDEHLRSVVTILRPRAIVGVGAYAHEKAKQACGDVARQLSILHPSPASPAANKGWPLLAQQALEAADLPGLL